MTEAEEYNLKRVESGKLSASKFAWLCGFYSVEQFQAATLLTPDGKVGPKTEKIINWHMRTDSSPGLLLDAARYQYGIDIGFLADRKIRGLYHKATEGTSYVDHRHEARAAESAQFRLKFGSYHFAKPSAAPAVQADHFLRNLSRGGLVPVLDIEGSGWTTVTAKKFCDGFLKRMEREGVPCVVYTGMHFLRRYLFKYRTPADLWLARYSRMLYEGRGSSLMHLKDKIALWQFQDRGGFVAGITRKSGEPGRIGVNMVMQDMFPRLLDADASEF